MDTQKVKRRIKLALLMYGILGILIYSLQELFLFRNVSLSPMHDFAFTQPFREVNIPFTDKVNLNIVQFLRTNPDSVKRGVVLYFHGNRKNIGWYARYSAPFTSAGYELWMVDYPGYGKSTGERSEENLYDFALQLYKLARSRYPADSIIIYGKSLGTGIAAHLASHQSCRRVILETPYYSLGSIVSSWLPIYPMEMMTRIKIPTYEYVQYIGAPLSIFHGTSDWTIPYRNARRLLPYLKKTDEFITVPGGSHNDLFNFPLVRQKLDSLLRK
jgi:pimeloyl-ACP methyl ester carboxylesterase